VSVVAPLLLSVLFARAAAASGEPPRDPADIPEEPPGGAGVSPVEIIPRVELRHSFVRMPNSVSVNVTTTQLDLQLFPRLLLRYELPVQIVKTPAGQISGLGDVQLSSLLILASGPTHLVGVLAGAVLDTATQPQLGAGKQQVSFGAGGAMKPRIWWIAYAVVNEQLSVGGNSARPDVNQLAFNVGNVVFGKRFTWFKLDLSTTVDFPNETMARFFGTLEVGTLMIGRVGLFVRSGTQLAGQRQVDYSLAGGLRYLFRLEMSRPRP
jgi:hypothetical protein